MLEEYYQTDHCTGVSLQISRNNDLRVTACAVSRKKNQLEIHKKVTGLYSIKQLPEFLPAKSIVSLNLNGKGVLHKRTEKFEKLTPEIFRGLLPNSEPADFYMQHFTSGAYAYISMIRKSDADKWLAEFKSIGIEIIMLSLGPFPVYSIMKQLNVYGGDFLFDGHEIVRDEADDWTGYSYREDSRSPYPLKADLEALDESLLVPYAAAFQVVLENRLLPVKAQVSVVDAALVQLTEKNKLKLYGLILLGFFFVVLSLNAWVFSKLFRENNELEATTLSSQQNTADLNDMEGQIKKKEVLLKQFGWDQDLNKALMIDRLASVLPADVTLDEVSVNPVDPAESRKLKRLQFRDRNIQVNGTSAGILSVNEWVARLKVMSWVKNCTIQSFTIDPEKQTGQFILTIQF
ncbi:Tfp pilus assembly protein PilN [Mucilaginibacter sp. UYNi724]